VIQIYIERDYGPRLLFGHGGCGSIGAILCVLTGLSYKYHHKEKKDDPTHFVHDNFTARRNDASFISVFGIVVSPHHHHE
jgi:hypothetical protein